jgi:hypothetical protein
MKKQDLVNIIRTKGEIKVLALLLLVFLFICGCGSDSKQSTQQIPEKAKPVLDKATGDLKVLEIPQSKVSVNGKTVQEEGETSKLPKEIDWDEEICPLNPPGKKMTQREFERLKKLEPKIDPQDEQVLPLSRPGHGLTVREFEALQSTRPKVDPLTEEVLPPSRDGTRGLTQRELDALKPLQPTVDPMDEEVLPLARPGEGMTVREMERMKAMGPKTPEGPDEIISPSPGAGSQGRR